MLLTIMSTGTALAMLAMTPARSSETPNGINPNALNMNGISLNSLTPNRLSANGHSSGANSFADDERATNSAGEIGRVVAVELAPR
jgi:hypothetical protein